jgi:hypothetical protein
MGHTHYHSLIYLFHSFVSVTHSRTPETSAPLVLPSPMSTVLAWQQERKKRKKKKNQNEKIKRKSNSLTFFPVHLYRLSVKTKKCRSKL